LGEQVTTEYANIRAELLMNNLSAIADIENRLVDATQVLSVLTGIYEEAARNSATYNAQPALAEEAQDGLPTPKRKRRKSEAVRES
jgi:hypothetical protein